MCLIFTLSAPAAQENTAHLTFKRTARSKQKALIYVVKPGDRLLRIIEEQYHPQTPAERMALVSQIKKLNPRLANTQRILEGQRLVLPESGGAAKEPGRETTRLYQAKKGESLIRIVRREMGISGSLLDALRQVKRLNPLVKDLNKIYPGQVIRLPGGPKSAGGDAGEDLASPRGEGEAAAPLLAVGLAANPLPSPERLAVLKYVIGRMNGSLTTTGFYYIPIQDAGQATIDCSRIPVVELDDGSTILMDFADLLPESLRAMIQAHWGSAMSVKVKAGEDLAAILQKTINASRSYTMSRSSKPLVAGDPLQIQFSPEWLITRKGAAAKAYLQGLSFLKRETQGLPDPMLVAAERHGILITDVSGETVLRRSGDRQAATPGITMLNAATNAERLSALLALLGLTPQKDAEVRIFDPAKDGFRLSIKADYLVKRGDKQVMFHSRTLPRQFISILEQNGTRFVFIGPDDPKKTLVEKVLQALEVPVVADRFAFRMPQHGEAVRATLTLPALKIEQEGKALYLVDYPVEPDLYGLLHEGWGVNLVKY